MELRIIVRFVLSVVRWLVTQLTIEDTKES